MRWLLTSLLTVTLFLAGTTVRAADAGKVLKVLPQYLDLQGRASLTPSLYDRDAYQAKLLAHRDLCSGLVFNVQWKAHKELKLRVEARGVLHGKTTSTFTLEQAAAKTTFSKWTKLTITGDDFKQLESLTAWRATLWDGDTQVSEYKSFLW